MTTFSYTLELDDGDHSTLSTALAMLKKNCLGQLETTLNRPGEIHPALTRFTIQFGDRISVN